MLVNNQYSTLKVVSDGIFRYCNGRILVSFSGNFLYDQMVPGLSTNHKQFSGMTLN
jgi:hypothetical protein